jgi:hypothetical protein
MSLKQSDTQESSRIYLVLTIDLFQYVSFHEKTHSELNDVTTI